MAPDAFGGS